MKGMLLKFSQTVTPNSVGCRTGCRGEEVPEGPLDGRSEQQGPGTTILRQSDCLCVVPRRALTDHRFTCFQMGKLGPVEGKELGLRSPNKSGLPWWFR